MINIHLQCLPILIILPILTILQLFMNSHNEYLSQYLSLKLLMQHKSNNLTKLTKLILYSGSGWT